jgi:acetyl-CoA carboxylase carboxyltransferase component
MTTATPSASGPVVRGHEDFDAVAELHELRSRAGGHGTDRPGRTLLLNLVDDGSFVELGTFAHDESSPSALGDGRVGGTARIGGALVVVAADEPGVEGGTSAQRGNERLDRLMDHARRRGLPFVFLASGGSARPGQLDRPEGQVEFGAAESFLTRRREVPMISVVTGEVSGLSAMIVGTSDLVVQIRGSQLAFDPEPVSSDAGDGPAVGSAAFHETVSGFVDLVVDDTAAAVTAVALLLELIPPNAWTTVSQDHRFGGHLEPDPLIPAAVPARRTRAYDVRRLIERIVDRPLGASADTPGAFVEFRRESGKGLVTAIARIDGWPVGIFASNPIQQAGAMDPAACDKAVRLLTLCDAFQIPTVFLQDVAGFLVGRQVEHGRMLFRAVRLLNALYAASTPTLTVVVRKAFGLAYEALNGRRYHSDAVYAWPGAEFGFMDPAVGVNVLYGDRKTKEEKAAIVADLKESTSPYGAAAEMNIDELIEPSHTRMVLAAELAALSGRRIPPPESRLLRNWPAK